MAEANAGSQAKSTPAPEQAAAQPSAASAAAETAPAGPETKPAPPRKTRFIFKVLGLLLVALALWMASYFYRTGDWPDLTDFDQQRKVLKQAETDVEAVGEVTGEAAASAVTWAQRSLADLATRIKGKPPQTKEESAALVKESKHATAVKPPPRTTPTPVPSPPSPLTQAREEYRRGEDAYASTDPMASADQVQKYLHVAEPLFSHCLDLLDQARQRGVKGPEIERLEQAAAKRLYDCRKRMVLHVQ